MSIIGKIQSLFSDREKTQPIFPITKTKAVSDDNGVGLDVLLEGKAPAGYPNACMTEPLGYFGGADAGKFDYYASLDVTEYSNGVVDVYLRGRFTIEAASTFDYGIDTEAVLAKINELTGKNYTTWETQRALHMDIIDAEKGLHLTSLMGYFFCVVRRLNASKLYLAIARIHSTTSSAGPWNLQQLYNATSNGSGYLNVCLRAKLS